MQDLHIAEIPYESGAIHFRYSRFPSEDGTRWIRHGLFVEYSESGVVLAEGNYNNGKEEGLWCSYHDNGQKAAEGHYAAEKKKALGTSGAPQANKKRP